MQFFYVRLACFTLYSNFFTFRGAFRESVDARYCSALLQSLRTRAHHHLRSSPHFRRPCLVLFFSNEQFPFHLISSHLTSNFHYQSINCPMPHYHPTISVLLLTLEGVKSPLLLSSMFFVSLLLCSFDPWCAPLLSSRGTTFSRSGRPTPLLSPHPHTFFRKFHTYKHIHTHISSPHTPGFTISSKCQTKKKIRSRAAAACASDHV